MNSGLQTATSYGCNEKISNSIVFFYENHTTKPGWQKKKDIGN